MKILVVAYNLQFHGGIQTSSRNLIKALRELGHEVRTAELKNPDLPRKVIFVFQFAREVMWHRPDFIFITNVNYSPMGFFANLLLGLPYSITFHGIEAKNIKSTLHRLAVKKAKNLVKVFDETGRNVLRQFPQVESKFVTIPNSVEGNKFQIRPKSDYLVEKFGLENSKVVLTIGRMSRLDGDNKGYKRVIQAMPRVLKEIPNAVYVLAGGGDDVENARALAEKLGLERKVIFTGRIADEDMVDFYNLGDVFALPSKNEGFPAIVLLESLACGVPVLGGAQPGAKETFDGKYGLIVKPDSVEEIGSALVKILTGNAPKNVLDRNWLRHTVLEEYGFEAYKKAVNKAVSRFSE